MSLRENKKNLSIMLLCIKHLYECLLEICISYDLYLLGPKTAFIDAFLINFSLFLSFLHFPECLWHIFDNCKTFYPLHFKVMMG